MRLLFLSLLTVLPFGACSSAAAKPVLEPTPAVTTPAGRYPAPPAGAKDAPAFDVTDAAGRHWSLADAQDKPLLIDFWATWCRPCLDALPDLNNFQRLHQRRIELLGLNIDLQGWSVAKPMAERYALAYPYAVAEPKLSKAFGAKGYPFMALLYKGKIVKTLVGGRRVKDLEKELAPWL